MIHGRQFATTRLGVAVFGVRALSGILRCESHADQLLRSAVDVKLDFGGDVALDVDAGA